MATAACHARPDHHDRSGRARDRPRLERLDRQILDVLIDNALHHGTGAIAVTLRRIAGGGAIDVIDEGTLTEVADREQIFQRGHGERNGIGLALARSIAEAEGGRLILTRPQPTTFSLILLDPEEHDG